MNLCLGQYLVFWPHIVWWWSLAQQRFRTLLQTLKWWKKWKYKAFLPQTAVSEGGCLVSYCVCIIHCALSVSQGQILSSWQPVQDGTTISIVQILARFYNFAICLWLLPLVKVLRLGFNVPVLQLEEYEQITFLRGRQLKAISPVEEKKSRKVGEFNLSSDFIATALHITNVLLPLALSWLVLK